MGSDGTVGANKEAVKIIAGQPGMHAQVCLLMGRRLCEGCAAMWTGARGVTLSLTTWGGHLSYCLAGTLLLLLLIVDCTPSRCHPSGLLRLRCAQERWCDHLSPALRQAAHQGALPGG